MFFKKQQNIRFGEERGREKEYRWWCGGGNKKKYEIMMMDGYYNISSRLFYLK